MIPDAECVKIVSEILTDLKLGDFTIKVRTFIFTHLMPFVCHTRMQWYFIDNLSTKLTGLQADPC